MNPGKAAPDALVTRYRGMYKYRKILYHRPIYISPQGIWNGDIWEEKERPSGKVTLKRRSDEKNAIFCDSREITFDKPRSG